MADKTIRLRVVVQRNSLPDNNFMLPVSFEDQPTIANLLEQVNNIYFPLESDQWGLEDYSVYRQASDGSRFECLHFSTIQSIFRDDDQVLIRPLQTDDLRRRRISGRYQISSDGKHLLDGVPFGRPMLRVPARRPPVYIPPRKKPRLVYDQQTSPSQEHVGDGNGDGDENEDTPMLLLTNGRAHAHQHPDQSHAEGDESDKDFQADEQQSANMEDEEDSPSEDDSELEADEDLEEELRALREENAALGETDEEEQQPVDTSPTKQNLDLETLDKISALLAAFPSAPLKICEKVLMASDGDLRKAYTTLSDGFPPELSDTATLAQLLPGPTKSTSQPHKAIANATAVTLAKNKTQHDEQDDDESPAGDSETEEVSAFVRQYDHRGLPPGSISSGKGLSHMATISSSFTRSRISGDSETTSTTLMDSNGGKPSPEKIVDEVDDDGTSSSGTSASSEDEESEDEESEEDDDSDDSDSSDEGSEHNVNILGGDADSDSDSDEGSDSNENPPGESPSSVSNSKTMPRSSDSSCDSANDSDSGPEEATTKGAAVGKSRARAGAKKVLQHSKAATSDDSNDSSLDGLSANDTTSDDSSGEDSSEADSDSEESSSDDESSSDSGSDEDQQDTETTTPPISEKTSVKPQITSDTAIAANQTAATTTARPTQPTPVPPGHGKESTKSRNARRRAAQKAKKEAQAQAQAGTAQITAQTTSSCPVSTSSAVHQGPPDNQPTNDQLLFEAKRKALLDAIDSGGVEVDSTGELIPDDSSLTESHVGSKRKRDGNGQEREPTTQEKVSQQTPISEPATMESDTSQKRRRVDMGAGRRLLFGALGLRNPKDKNDEEKLRAKLMEGVRPLTNHRLEQKKSDTKKPDASVAEPHPSGKEDPGAWRDLIIYRAVECCQEGIELSEPPFPFVQRWDPQQQTSWFHKNSDKRGGQGKRAQRNEAHFYQEERTSNKKRKHDESVEWGGEGYDETFNGIEDDVQDENNIQLNYDDVVEPDQETNDATAEASQFTDLDDLPSLPPDLSSLPVLRPGEVKPGMVITWKKWLCSAATRWQPCVSHFTGVVVRIDDDATGVEVCLAKRDRNLDSSQKRYDPVTGKRVYDKFEAPDLEEEENGAGEGDAGEDDAGREDEGYRTVSFADMVEPKILQHPFSFVEGSDPVEAASASHPPKNSVPEVPEAQPEVESHVPESSLAVVGDQKDAGIDATVESSAPASALATGDEGQNASHSTDHQAGQGQDPTDQAGLSLSDTSQISSPSRQLHETTSQAAGTTPNDPSAIESSGYRGDVDTDAIDTTAPLLSDPVASREQSSAPAFGGDDDEVITGTPKARYAAKLAAPSSVGSVHSGRQLDYTMEEDDDEPDSLRVTEADDEVHGHGVSTILGADDDSPGLDHEEDVTTPTPSPTKLFSSDHQVTPIKATEPPSKSPSTPDSLASINTIFCTAKTSRQTQSPSKSQSQAEKTVRNPVTRTAKDLEYEEAMRKLEEQSVADRDEEESSNIPDSFRPLDLGNDDNDDSQMSVDAVIKDEQLSLPKLRRRLSSAETKISPPPPKRAARKRLNQPKEASSQFTLPPGTQVIDLLSSSDAEQEPEPHFTEHYADEDADETYSPKGKSNTSSSLPKGPGWISKVNGNKKTGLLDRTRNPTRSSTAPLSSRQFGGRHAGKGLSSSQGPSQSPSQSQTLSSSLPELSRKGGPNGGSKGRRKTSARF